MAKKSRRHFTPEQKAAIVRRRLVNKVPVSDLCDEYKLQPSMLYTWQKAVVDGAARVFEAPTERGRGSSRESELDKRIEQLEAKLAKKEPQASTALCSGSSRACTSLCSTTFCSTR